MDVISSPLTITQLEVIQALAVIRNQWEDAAQGNSLTRINGSVGYLLFDVAVALGLEGMDLRIALGDLADEVVEILSQKF